MSSHTFIIADIALISLFEAEEGPAISRPLPGPAGNRLVLEMKTPRLRVGFVESPRSPRRGESR